MEHLLSRLDQLPLLLLVLAQDLLQLVLVLLALFARLHRLELLLNLVGRALVLGLAEVLLHLLHLVLAVAVEERVVLAKLDFVKAVVDGRVEAGVARLLPRRGLNHFALARHGAF